MMRSLFEFNETGRFASIFRALSSRNYRLYFTGQSVSLIGLWMQRVAMSWLVYRLTLSPFCLGLNDFFSQVPAALLGFFTGVWLDRWDLKRVIMLTQSFALLQALLLAGLTFSDRITFKEILLLSLMLGAVNAFDMPARQSFIVQLVERKEDLGNAIALNSSVFNLARLIGPSLGGLVIAAVGEGICFLLNALSYLGTLFALHAIVKPKRVAPRLKKPILEGMVEGWRYAFGFLPIRRVLMLLSVISIAGMPYLVLMPVVAQDLLQGGPQTLGFLFTAVGLGSLAGALQLAARPRPVGLARNLPRLLVIFSISLMGLALSRNVWLSLLLAVPAGYGTISTTVSCNTLLQTLVDDDKRGRVMSLYNFAMMGTAPLGSLLAGTLSTFLGVPFTFFLGAISCLGIAWVFNKQLPEFQTMTRPVYIRKGLLS